MPDIDIELLKKIVSVLKENNLAKIEYKTDNVKIEIKSEVQGVPPVQVVSPVQGTFPTQGVQPIQTVSPEQVIPQEQPAKHNESVTSPMVGTCYLAPEPGADNFVSVGDIVKKDQPLMIIEAMKVMNYIKSPKDGKVINIAVQDAQPIEYGQLLLVIEDV